jgi:branched-chain amino acid transport system substrate-binding protein
LTGSLAGFASGDKFVVDTVRATSAYSKGFKVGGKTYKVNVIVADSQSDPNRASQLARQLILNNNVDLLVTTSTPETANPVAVVAETEGVPCLSTVVPWESWYAGLGGNPLKPTMRLPFCTMFFFGTKQFQDCFVPMWNRVAAGNKNVACMYPNDSDGNAFRAGFEPLIVESGYKVVDGGAYSDGTTNFTPMITRFKARGCEYFSNAPIPPDFSTFWKQTSQQGWKPKLATVAKVLLFPADTVALGPLAANIATDSWWGPYMPTKSSLDGRSAASLANAFQAQTGNQWVQSIGSTYALFEVAHQAFTSVGDPHDKQAVASALHKVHYTGMCGPLNFSAGPAPGVAIINPVGVQWKKGSGKYPFEMKVVDNSLNSAVKVGATLEPTNLLCHLGRLAMRHRCRGRGGSAGCRSRRVPGLGAGPVTAAGTRMTAVFAHERGATPRRCPQPGTPAPSSHPLCQTACRWAWLTRSTPSTWTLAILPWREAHCWIRTAVASSWISLRGPADACRAGGPGGVYLADEPPRARRRWQPPGDAPAAACAKAQQVAERGSGRVRDDDPHPGTDAAANCLVVPWSSRVQSIGVASFIAPERGSSAGTDHEGGRRGLPGKPASMM